MAHITTLVDNNALLSFNTWFIRNAAVLSLQRMYQRWCYRLYVCTLPPPHPNAYVKS